MNTHEPATFFSRGDTEIGKKVNFLVNCTVPNHFKREIFWGQYPRKPYALRIQKIYFVWVTEPSLGFEVLAAQSEVIGKNRSCYENKSRKGSKTLRPFSSDCFETNRTWTHHIGVNVLFVSDLSDEIWWSIFDLLWHNLVATNFETSVYFGRL